MPAPTTLGDPASPSAAAEVVLEPLDVVLAEVLAGLHLDEDEVDLADNGNPFVAGREVGKDGETSELDFSGVPMTGYTIVNAADMDTAQALLDGLPMIHSTRIYELGSM